MDLNNDGFGDACANDDDGDGTENPWVATFIRFSNNIQFHICKSKNSKISKYNR